MHILCRHESYWFDKLSSATNIVCLRSAWKFVHNALTNEYTYDRTSAKERLAVNIIIAERRMAAPLPACIGQHDACLNPMSSARTGVFKRAMIDPMLMMHILMTSLRYSDKGLIELDLVCASC